MGGLSRAELPVDMLGLEEGLEALDAVKPPQTAFLEAACLDRREQLHVIVDPDVSTVDPSGHRLRGRQVICPDGYSKTERAGIGLSNRIIDIFEGVD